MLIFCYEHQPTENVALEYIYREVDTTYRLLHDFVTQITI